MTRARAEGSPAVSDPAVSTSQATPQPAQQEPQRPFHEHPRFQQLIRERLVDKKGFDLHFDASNAQVFDRIAANPQFRQGDKFSIDVWRDLDFR